MAAEFAAGAASVAQLPPPVGVEVAFAGRSNVGKSSLLNALMNRKNLVRTSSTPGCTRQISFFKARAADDVVFTLVDLPGYGYAKRSKTERLAWAELIERYLLERPTLAAVAVLVDVRRGLEPDDRDLLTLLATTLPNRRPLKVVLVATKLDKLPRSARLGTVKRLADDAGKLPFVGFSVHEPDARDALWATIRRVTELG